MSERGAAFVKIASRDSTDLIVVPENKIRYPNSWFLGNYKKTLQDQTWALILEPADVNGGEWKRIGIARIADGLVDGWEARVVTII